jgi:D-sedoheptulose 7-phosphate isomerase
MKRLAEAYYCEIERLLNSIRVADADGRNLDFFEGVSAAIGLIQMQTALGGKLIFIGNGASAAISSHQATDFWKNGRMRAIAFNDASGLTCVSNDFGYEHVFEKPIMMFADPGDVLIAISSSGQSKNVLLGVMAAKARDVRVITLSGFDEDNPLQQLGEINFYVPSSTYGHVEILHLSICHCLLDVIIERESELLRESVSGSAGDAIGWAEHEDIREEHAEMEVKAIRGAKKHPSHAVQTE